MPASKDAKNEELSFEEALKRLETIVETMENGDLALEDLVIKFAEGDTLLKSCNKRLKTAELKIEKLKDNTNNQFESFENDAE